MSRNSIIIYYLFFGFLILLFIGLLNNRRFKNKIKADHDVVCGEIITIKPNRSGGLMFYRFNYKGQVIKTSASCLTSTKKDFEAGRKKILVVVLKNNIDHSDILESEKDFFKYSITYLDTVDKKCKD